MKFIHLTIENFGPFKGVQNVPLGSKAEKSINVIYGTNGSGKTFFIRSILWALGLWDPNTNRHYYRQLVHEGASSASILLKFTFGAKYYEVSRRLYEAKNGRKQVEVELFDQISNIFFLSFCL
jgi:DNA sulfur modification protein DndD